MTLMRCPECDRKVSDAAAICPGCGRPLAGAAASDRAAALRLAAGFEYRSRREVMGLPLVHVVYGPAWLTGFRAAKGIVAIGNVAVGVVALGGVALGGLAVGGLSLGLVCVGGVALGLGLGLGGIATGLVAAGGIAVGMIALGGLAIRLQAALGQASLGHVPALALMLPAMAAWRKRLSAGRDAEGADGAPPSRLDP